MSGFSWAKFIKTENTISPAYVGGTQQSRRQAATVTHHSEKLPAAPNTDAAKETSNSMSSFVTKSQTSKTNAGDACLVRFNLSQRNNLQRCLRQKDT
jgi:hypothetical protein